MPVTIKFAIICDDVRREDTGKMIIIGAYGRDIGVSSFPVNIALAAALSFSIDKAGTIPLEVKWSFDGNEISKSHGSIRSDGGGVSLINIPPMLLGIERPGTLEFNVRFDKGKWETPARLPVVVRAPTASPQPS
jgi:hypothetical protein